MCLDRISIGGLIMRGMLPDAERVMPGHGCELLDAFAVVADVSMLVGFVGGGAALWIAGDLVRAALRSRCYLRWKEARNAD